MSYIIKPPDQTGNLLWLFEAVSPNKWKSKVELWTSFISTYPKTGGPGSHTRPNGGGGAVAAEVFG